MSKSILTFLQHMNSLQEKGLSKSEVQSLINRAVDSAQKVSQDKKKTKEERNRAVRVMKWISDVSDTFERQGSIHPNTVNGLMRIVTGTNSGRYGYMVPDDGSVPADYRS